jgi:hypothetical protein
VRTLEETFKYGELLKAPARQIAHEPNPCRRLLGKGPDGARCKTCSHLQALRYANTYYKCDLRLNTSGPGTDHRVNWLACASYQKCNWKGR